MRETLLDIRISDGNGRSMQLCLCEVFGRSECLWEKLLFYYLTKNGKNDKLPRYKTLRHACLVGVRQVLELLAVLSVPVSRISLIT